MSLTKILADLKAAKVFADEDVSAGAIETLNSRRNRKRNAIVKVEELTEQYSRELLKTGVFVVVTGAHRDTFVETAKDKYSCFSTELNAFFDDLASRINPQLYVNKPANQNLLEVVGRHLEDKAMQIGINSYPMLIFKNKYQRRLTSKDDLVTFLREIIMEQIGPEIIGINGMRAIVPQAIARGHALNLTPMVIGLEDDQLASTLIPALKRLTPTVFLVHTGKPFKGMKVTGAIQAKDGGPESVETALGTIRNSIK